MDSANLIQVLSNNYIVDGNKISLSNFTVKNSGHISQGNLTYLVSGTVNINKSTGGSISYTCNKTKILLAGEQPAGIPIDWSHAQLAEYGSASGTCSSGESFTATIPQSNWAVRNFNCLSYRRYFVGGEIDFTPSTKPTRYINFGTGSCDNQANIAISGNIYTITLP